MRVVSFFLKADVVPEIYKVLFFTFMLQRFVRILFPVTYVSGEDYLNIYLYFSTMKSVEKL